MKKFALTFLKIIAFFIGWAVVVAALIDIPSEDPAIWRFYAELIPLAVMIVFTAVFLLIERGSVKIPVIRNFGTGLSIGLAIGIIWIGVCLGVLFLTGNLSLVSQNVVDKLWLWIISAFLNVIMQELLVRGYLYRLLRAKYNLPAAVIVTTALFTLMHGGSFEAGIIPVVNVATMCLFTTALYEAAGTIVAPIMAHAVWNIIGSLIIGAVDLAEDYPKLFTVALSGNTLLSGGEYKIEGSVVVTAVNTALMLIFFGIAWNRRHKSRRAW